MPFERRLNLQSMAIDPRLEKRQGIKQLPLDFFNVRSEAPVQLADAKVNHGMVSLLIVGERQVARALVGGMADGIEKPIQIAKHSCLIALQRNDPLIPALLASGRIVVCQTIKQTRLKPIEWSDEFTNDCLPKEKETEVNRGSFRRGSRRA